MYSVESALVTIAIAAVVGLVAQLVIQPHDLGRGLPVPGRHPQIILDAISRDQQTLVGTTET